MNPPPPAVAEAFFQPEDVCLPLYAESAEAAIRKLVLRLHTRSGGFDPDAAVTAVLSREKIMPVVMERELAMPHARLPGLDKPLIAVGICPAGIPFPSSADPIKVVVLALTPSADPTPFLRILTAVNMAIRSPEAISRLAAARTPAEVMEVFGVVREHLPDFLDVRHVMETEPVVLRETDTLESAVELFAAKRIMDIPVVNDRREVLGTIAIEDLLRLALPDHLRWMEDLSPILRFEPFTDLVKGEFRSPVTRFMREDILSIAPDKPAVQLAKLFLLDERRQVVVVENRRLLGTVDLPDYVRKLFWD